MYREEFSHDSWSIQDSRLSGYNELTRKYDGQVLLRTDYERRLVLIELDVLAAMTLGFSLKDLETVYVGTFSTTQKYEADTWYDANGRVIYSVSSEYDLKLPRKLDRKLGLPGWEDIRGELSEDGMTYFGVEPVVGMVVSEKKSQIYSGKEIVFHAPYTRCDRIADYRRAWTFFEERFKNED